MRMTASTRGVPGLQNHYFLPEDHRLFYYDQIFSVSSMWVELGMENVIATYDLFVRDAPKNRNFLLFGGLEEIIENIKAWRFTKDEVDFLLNNNIIKPKMAMNRERFEHQIGRSLTVAEASIYNMAWLDGSMTTLNYAEAEFRALLETVK